MSQYNANTPYPHDGGHAQPRYGLPGTVGPADASRGYPQGSYSTAPQTGYPQGGGYPQTGYPQTGYPQTGYPQTGYPAANPYNTAPLGMAPTNQQPATYNYGQGAAYQQPNTNSSTGQGYGGYPTSAPQQPTYTNAAYSTQPNYSSGGGQQQSYSPQGSGSSSLPPPQSTYSAKPPSPVAAQPNRVSPPPQYHLGSTGGAASNPHTPNQSNPPPAYPQYSQPQQSTPSPAAQQPAYSSQPAYASQPAATSGSNSGGATASSTAPAQSAAKKPPASRPAKGADSPPAAAGGNSPRPGAPASDPVLIVPPATSSPVANDSLAQALAAATVKSESELDLPDWLKGVPRHIKPFEHHKHRTEVLDAKTFTEEQIEAAETEHVKNRVPFLASYEEMHKSFGPGCVYFFDFIKFICLANIFLVICQAINYIVFAVDEKPGFYSRNTTQGYRRAYSDFFITAYNSDHKPAWLALNIISLVYCVVAAPMYYAIMRCRVAKEESDEELTDRILRYQDDGTVDVSFYYRSAGNLFARRLLSAVVFFSLLGFQVIGSNLSTRTSDQVDLGTAFGIAILVAVLNVIYTFIAKLMTEFEKWFTFGAWKKSLLLKLIFFKLANIVTVFASKNYDQQGKNACVYDLIGEQFLAVLIIEMLLMNLWDLLLTIIHRKNYERYASIVGSITGDYDNMPQFDLSFEYLQVIYRQYLAILSMVVFPLSIAGCAIGFFFQFLVAKIRLYKLCGKPRHMAKSQKGFLAFNLIFIAVISFFTPYAGSIWVMVGWTRDKSTLCHFP